MRRLFPAAKIDVLLREPPGDLAPRIEADSIRVVTFEERSSVVRELQGALELRWRLPCSADHLQVAAARQGEARAGG